MHLWWLSLSGSSLGFTLGSILLKRFADTGSLGALSLSFAIFAASNLAYAWVIRSGLGTGVVASSMLQIMIMAALGVLVFGERMNPVQLLGVLLAAASIFLILYPAQLRA